MNLIREEVDFLHRFIGRTDILAFADDFLLAMRLYERLGNEIRIPQNGGQSREQKCA